MKKKTNAKKASKNFTKRAKKRVNKAALVRALPRSLSAKEAVIAAKEAGVTVSAAYVYNVRALKKNGKKGAKRAKSAAPGAVPGAEELLKALATEIGMGRSFAILREERERIVRILGAVAGPRDGS